tara:strand:+ start:10103 stop:11866 length:1764 start_codon:yes stop_codon:yes gene_type:complete
MAFITLSGTLLDPNGDLAVGDQIRFTHKSTTGETVESAVSLITVNPAGTYSLPLQYGLVLVEYKDVRTQQFKNLGVATVNGSNPATSIPELLNALVPVSSAELIEFQAILADCVAAQTAAENAATTAEAFAYQLTTTDLIASTATFAAATNIPTSGFTTSGDGGNGSWKQNGVTGQTPSQSPAQLGDALLNDGNGNQWALVGDLIDVRSLGYVGDGVAEDQLSIIAAGSSGRTIKITGPSICNLASNATVNANTEVITDNNVTFIGAGIISGIGIADQSLMSKNSGFLGLLDSLAGTRIGKYFSYRKTGAPTSSSESDALLVIATQEQDSTTYDADLVGVGARAYIPSSNTNGRVWALNAYARITSGGDGLVHGAEINLENGGSDNAVPDTALAKYGINITTKSGSNGCTAAIKIGTGSEFHHGMWAAQNSFVSINSSFLQLKDLFDVDAQGRVSVGTATHSEQMDVGKANGRSQVAISSDGAGGEASTKYTDTGTRNWTTGHWFDTGRYTVTTQSNLATGQVFEIDGNGSFGFNGFSIGGGQGVIFVADAATVPTSNPTGGGIFYVEAGALKFRGSSGTITTIAPA